MIMAVVINHTMTEEQRREAREVLSVETFKFLPPELKDCWGDIDPEKADFDPALDIVAWLKRETDKNDYVFIQGHHGLTFAIVSWCMDTKRKPVYATTKREVIEKQENGKTVTKRIFKHCMFREYRLLGR